MAGKATSCSEQLTVSSMFFHLQYIHLFRPFLKYAPNASPLPPHVSPRRICTANAGAISKLMRLYKKLYNLRQICNIAVYMLHSACTIHLLNLPEKTAKRDITHGIKHLEEIAEDWLCGRRTLSILSVLVRKWNVELPEEAAHSLQRADERWGTFSTSEVPSPRSHLTASPSPPAAKQEHYSPAHLVTYGNGPASRMAPGLTMAPEMMGGFASGSTDFGKLPNMQTVGGAAVGKSPAALNMDNVTGVNWRQPSLGHTIPSYARSYAAVSSSSGDSSQPSRTATRNVTPSSSYAIDGSDWYLRDGANWQSSFDTWTANNNNTGISGDPSVFMFTANANNTGNHAAAQRSPPASSFDFDSIENLANSMTPWDSLPGLE